MLTPSFVGISRKALTSIATVHSPLGILLWPASSREGWPALPSEERGKQRGRNSVSDSSYQHQRGFVFLQPKLLMLNDIKKEIKRAAKSMRRVVGTRYDLQEGTKGKTKQNQHGYGN